MTYTVSVREANQRFSNILSRVSQGEVVVITKRGEPIAKLVKYSVDDALGARAAAWDRLTGILESGVSLGGSPFDRDKLYDRI